MVSGTELIALALVTKPPPPFALAGSFAPAKPFPAL